MSPPVNHSGTVSPATRIPRASAWGFLPGSMSTLEAVDGIPVLPPAPEIPQVASAFMAQAILPAKAQVDALHIAAVAHHRIDYLLTWNCSHIANARILPRMYSVLRERNLPIPIICTPEELLGDDSSTDA